MVDVRGVKFRYDRNFSVEDARTYDAPKTIIYCSIITKACAHGDGQWMYTLADFGDKSSLGIRKQSLEGDSANRREIALAWTGYPLAGRSYVMAFNPDETKLAATSFVESTLGYERVMINVFSTEPWVLLWRLEDDRLSRPTS